MPGRVTIHFPTGAAQSATRVARHSYPTCPPSLSLFVAPRAERRSYVQLDSSLYVSFSRFLPSWSPFLFPPLLVRRGSLTLSICTLFPISILRWCSVRTFRLFDELLLTC